MSGNLALPAPAQHTAAPGTPPLMASTRAEGPVLVAVAMLLCLLLALAVQACALAAPLLTMHIFDAALQNHNRATLTVIAIAYGLSLVLGGVLGWMRSALLGALAARLGRRLQLRALHAAVRSALAGDRLRGLTALQDIAELRRLLGGNLAAELLDLLTAPAVLGFLWLLHPAYAVVALLTFVLQALLGAAAHRTTHGMQATASAGATRVLAGLATQLRQRDMLLGLGMLPAILRRWAPRHALALEAQDAAQRRLRAIQSLLLLLGFAQTMAMVIAGALLITRQQVSPGSLLAATLLAGMVTSTAGHLMANWHDWAAGLAAWRRLRGLVAALPAGEDAAHPAEATPGLVVRGLGCRAPGGGPLLVQDLDLALQPGEAVAVQGPNGTGKTTLLRALMGLAEPAAGQALLDGAATHQAERGAIGPRIGYLPQEAQLLEGSIAENISRFTGDLPGAVAAARLAGAHAAIGRLPQGYESPAGAAAGLSGGQQRLVALARALFGQPRLLLLDEPEAALDAPAQVALRQAVLAARGWGAAIVIVTHQPAFWDGLVQQRLHLERGGAWRRERVG